MKLTPWYLAALAPIAIAGCSGAMMGHLAVLVVTIGIFVGTLSLGKHSTATASAVGLTSQPLEPAASLVAPSVVAAPVVDSAA